MTFTQRLISRLLGPGVERESREWMVECLNCGHAESVWDRGGIRYKASGTKRVYAHCRACGKSGMHTVRRSP